MIDATIVIYNNSISELIRVKECFFASKHSNSLTLIDNSSFDFNYESLIDSKTFLIRSKENIGFGKGHNLAVNSFKPNQCPYLLILNPDIIFDGAVLDILVNRMNERQDIGMCMPRVLYRNGDNQFLARLYPSPLDLIARRFFGINFNPDYELRRFSELNEAFEVPLISGCFLFLRKGLFETVGGFSDQYFMYLEDYDLCRKISTFSKIMYYPDQIIYHGFKKASYSNLKLTLEHVRSAIKFFNKWGWFFDSDRRIKNKSTIVELNKIQSKNKG